MNALKDLLRIYQSSGTFPSYKDLAGIAERTGHAALTQALADYRAHSVFPNFSQLTAFAASES